ncbi:MAG: monofunctional biosynthetic peptidoglycan transglycosylase [Betaproteobacteria bacterium]|nr:monofunctional biosynthetic peptidoglycan transglycosylase [Betaproteobacteria bacterium]
MSRRLAWRAAGACAAAFLLYQAWILAHVLWWVHHNPASTAFMRERLAVLKRQHPDARITQQWVPYARISANLKRALVADEDSTFIANDGFDWAGIRHAFDTDLRRRKIVAGGSTITQQLAKNLFLSSSRTPWRKGEEALITVMLDHLMTKRRVLALYLNVIEWGDNGVFGAQAAARHYFHANAAYLTPWQAARLAAMVPDPRYFDSHRHAPELAWHTRIILARMHLVAVPR